MLPEETLPNASENSKAPAGETIKELAHRHLTNAEHTTTDEELKNARLEFTEVEVDPDNERMFEVDQTPVLQALPSEENKQDKEEEDDDEDENNKDRGVPNPYDVLGS